jgi:hypothetical protein
MIDYHTHVAVLHDLQKTIASGVGSDPVVAARIAELAAATATDPDAAVLGALVDHVMAHAASDGTEIQIIESAAALWTRGLLLYTQFSDCRQGIESVLQNPADPSAVQTFQTAVDALDGLRTSLKQLVSESQLLHATLKPLPHLKEHPRQLDKPSKQWDFGNLFAARRTEAFVRATFDRAASVRGQAFAFGVLASYAGNVAGSAYLGQTVGGPRRSHRFRDRLARNTVGAWLHAHVGTPPTSALSKQLEYQNFAGSVGFPIELKNLVAAALQDVFPSHTAADVDLGLSRMVRHLRLLDTFRRPPLPDPPPPVLVQAADPSGGTLTTMSDDLKPPGIGIPLDPDMTPGTPSKSDSSNSGGALCLAILLVIITIGIALLIYCIGKWTTGKECKASDFFDEFQGSSEPDPRAPTGTNQQQLTAMAAPDAAAHIAQELYNYHMVLWQAFDLAFAYLSSTGLIYPDDLIMSSPLYTQFVSSPNRAAWPHRQEATPAETYHVDPASPIEQPATASPFTAGATPSALLPTWAPGESHSVLPIAQRLLLQIVRRVTDSQNYDLDADRSFLHACWETAPGTSISDSAIAVQILPYTAE